MMDLFLKTELVIKRLLSLLHTFFISLLNSKVKIGCGSIVYYRSHIVVTTRLGGAIIGKNTRIGCSSKLCHTGLPFYSKILVDGKEGRVIVGDNCRINGAYIHAENKIQIGNNCVMAAGVHIMDSNGHIVNSTDRTVGRDDPKEIVIGNNVWIGLNSIILKGTCIGDNSVVAAGSVVKGEFPDNAVIAGNPAKVVKHLDI